MGSASTVSDYKTDARPPKPAPKDVATGKTSAPGAASSSDSASWRAPDFAQVQEFVHLLARALHQVHTYPATSPLSLEAISACHRALQSAKRDRVVFRVTPREVIVDDVPMGAGTVVEFELARRLHRAKVAQADVDCSASLRDISRFCVDVSAYQQTASDGPAIADVLAEHGVGAIVAHMAARPEVIEVGVPSKPRCTLIEHERVRREAMPAADGPVQHLYPADKGWVRLDPGAGLNAVSLVDLAILVDDPAHMATLLLRLTDQDAAASTEQTAALEQKFSDVAMLFGAMDPRLARLMFSKLSRAVLDLEPSRRNALLKRTVLPGLLDGRPDAVVLQDFPDLDLADALCLLLDLETAAPEVVTTALNRLGLPEERRATIAPLLEARLRNEPRKDASAWGDQGLEGYARRLMRVDGTSDKSFAEFAAFDLSLNDQTRGVLEQLRDDVVETDAVHVQLACVRQLVRLEPNPEAVTGYLGRAWKLALELERENRWTELATFVTSLRQLADELRAPRPDVADAIGASLSSFWTTRRVQSLGRLHQTSGAGHDAATMLVAAFGDTLGPPLIAALEDAAAQDDARAINALSCDHASLLAPGFAARLATCAPLSARVVVRVLGFAGHGFEAALSRHLTAADEQTGREALRALARIGTHQAAAAVAAQMRDGVPWARAAAEEALWHLPAPQMLGQVRDLLGRRDFLAKHPDVAARLLDRAAQNSTDALSGSLAAIAPLRFRIWSPAVARLGRKAHQLMQR